MIIVFLPFPCRKASVAVKRDQEEVPSGGRGLRAETTNPQSACDDPRDDICHVVDRRCVCSGLSNSCSCFK